MPGAARLFARALWWRRGLSLAILLVGVIGTAVATLGPLYARAAAESTLNDRLTSSPGASTGLSFVGAGDLSDPATLSDQLARSPQPGSITGYPSTILGSSTLITAQVPGEIGNVNSTLVYRQGECQHLVVVSGRCPTAPGEALVDDNAVHDAPSWRLGQRLNLNLQGPGAGSPGGNAIPLPGNALTPVVIVGSYRPADPDDPYWFGRSYFTGHLAPAAVAGVVDAVFVSSAEFSQQPRGTRGEVDVDFPRDADAIRLANANAVKAQVLALQRRFPIGSGDATATVVRTKLPAVLDAARRDGRQVSTTTLLVVLELALLSWLVLFQVVTNAIESRGNEIALAKLRGLRPRDTVVFALGEPIGLLALALPLGFGLAWGAVQLLARSALAPHTPVLIDGAVPLALFAAFAGGVLAAVVGGWRTLTRSVLEQWRSTGERPSPRWRQPTLALALTAVSVAALLRLRSAAASPSSGSLLAPALIVFAVAAIALALAPAAGRAGVRATRGTARVALFLSVRQTSRRRAGLRLAALLIVAIGLASFAIAGEAVAAGNRSARAQNELGAPRVAAIQFQATVDPQAVVRQVDPSGSWAMAAAEWAPSGGAASGGPAVLNDVLAVEPTRLAAVGFHARDQVSPARVAALIGDPKSPPPATFTGDQVRVQLDAGAINGPAPQLGVKVRPQHGSAVTVAAGSVFSGVRSYDAAVDCQGGCAFLGLVFSPPPGVFASAVNTVTLTAATAHGASGWSAIAVVLDRPAAWRASNVGVSQPATVTAGPAGVTDRFTTADGSSAVLGYADSPTPLPLVAGAHAVPDPAGRVTIAGTRGALLDYTGAQADFVIAASTAVVPVLGDEGAVGSLDYLRAQLPDFDYEANWSIWLGPHAPADALSRLRAAGLIIGGVRTENARVAELGRQGPALALLLLLVCAVAAAILSVGATAVSLLASGRRRAFELAALRVVGVPDRVLRRTSVLEQLTLLGAGLVFGVPTGYAVGWLVMPSLATFTDPTPVPLRYGPPVGPVLALAAAFAVLLSLTAVFAGRTVARAAVPARLREADR
ncbi:MAG: hypothetical protein JWO63_2086 [Frankiales bacterium]|nr:hypothetical protein [Frankiales bacterium]